MTDFKLREIKSKRGGSGLNVSLQNVKVSAASIKMVQAIQNFEPKVIFDLAKFPFFDDKSICLRALKALCLGTDVFIGGINNIGPTKLDEFCKKMPVKVCMKICCHLCVKNKNFQQSLYLLCNQPLFMNRVSHTIMLDRSCI